MLTRDHTVSSATGKLISHPFTDSLYSPARTLRSQDKHLLAVAAVSILIGSQGFSYAAPSIWNKIPVEIRNSSSLASLKKHLKALSLVPSLAHHLPP